jgi:rhamnose utilization protein RhaD (predicted bifunctional aldolase and dehydrogenase)
MQSDKVLAELVMLSCELGREDRGLVILGEGNTSADIGDGTFWVKASGVEMNGIDQTGFSRASLDGVLDLLNRESLTEDLIEAGLHSALFDKTHRRPSVETFLHAISIREGGWRFVGHTHAVSVLKIVCSEGGSEPLFTQLFPEAFGLLGRAPLVIPYTDPGYRLARAVSDGLRRYQDQYGQSPKVMYMLNHGVVTFGKTAKEVLARMLMVDKVARVLDGTHNFGGPHGLTHAELERLEARPDEGYRMHQLK